MTVLKNFGAIDLKNEGAKMDGVTDDLAAWNRAITKGMAERRPVMVPPGTSRVSGPVDVELCDIRGISPTSSKVTFDTGGFFSSTNTNQGYGIYDLLILGSATAGQVLIDFTGQNYPRMENLYVDNSDVGIRFARIDGGVESHYGAFVNVHINRCNRGVEYLQVGVSSGANSHTFVGGRFSNMTAPGGVGVWIDGSTNNLNFFGTYFEVGANNWAVDSAGINVSFVGCRRESGLGFNLRAGAGRHTFQTMHPALGPTAITDANTPPAHIVLDEIDDPFERHKAAAGEAICRSDRLWASYNRDDLATAGTGAQVETPDLVASDGDVTFIATLMAEQVGGANVYYTDRAAQTAGNRGITARYLGSATINRFAVFVSDGSTQVGGATTANVSQAGPSGVIKVGGFRISGTTLNSFFFRPESQEIVMSGDFDISGLGSLISGNPGVMGAQTDGASGVTPGNLYNAAMFSSALTESEMLDTAMFMYRDLGRFSGTRRSRTNSTVNRPTRPCLGEAFFDTTLARPIWWDGTNWIDSTGTTV